MSLENYTLTIVIPCYNERENIITIVEKILKTPILNKEIIVVDDMSTDGTREILEQKVKPLVSKIVYHKQNGGKGAALKTGFAHATGDMVIIQDADLEYDPMEYEQVIAPIVKGEADVVYGSRFLASKAKGYVTNRMANKFLTKLSNLFTHLKLTDMETCYKAFKREIIQSVDIEEKRFGFEPEITAKISRMDIRIKEVPISYYPRTMEEGKKIGFKDGLRAIYCIWKYRK
ncbi:MAG: glycosyltransferase family 2 protein [Roseburia sp.]|nr:glycosyltransferase family 2 protein [Roseburia sp.]MCM1280202.1 glycosyltransferase family 2 protein [Robinsoniella sp.]